MCDPVKGDASKRRATLYPRVQATFVGTKQVQINLQKQAIAAIRSCGRPAESLDQCFSHSRTGMLTSASSLDSCESQVQVHMHACEGGEEAGGRRLGTHKVSSQGRHGVDFSRSAGVLIVQRTAEPRRARKRCHEKDGT